MANLPPGRSLFGPDGAMTRRVRAGRGSPPATQPLVIETSCDQPGFVNIEVRVLGEDGKRLKDAKNAEVMGSFGAGVDPDKLEGVAEPADFDAFWDKQRAKLKAVPVRATLVPVEGNAKFDIFDVKIDCPGGKPVSGYLAKPKGAGRQVAAG